MDPRRLPYLYARAHYISPHPSPQTQAVGVCHYCRRRTAIHAYLSIEPLGHVPACFECYARETGVTARLQPQHLNAFSYEDDIIAYLDMLLSVERVFYSLTKRGQTVFLMYILGYTQEEIADVLGISQRGVGKKIQKILKIFRKVVLKSAST